MWVTLELPSKDYQLAVKIGNQTCFINPLASEQTARCSLHHVVAMFECLMEKKLLDRQSFEKVHKTP